MNIVPKTQLVARGSRVTEFNCLACDQRLAVDEGEAGNKISCPVCQRIVPVPVLRLETRRGDRITTLLIAAIAIAPILLVVWYVVSHTVAAFDPGLGPNANYRLSIRK